MVTTYGVALVVVGVILILIGIAGIWLAMNSPIQMQPIPLIVSVLGAVVIFLGGLLFGG